MKGEQRVMNTRMRISIFALSFLVIIPGLALVSAPALTAKAIASAISTSRELPSPTATQPPTISEQITQAEKSVVDPSLAFLNFVAALLITLLVILIIRRIWYLSHTSNLIIETFKNSTSFEGLDKRLTGLSLLTRENLVQELESKRKVIEEYKNLRPNPNRPPPKFEPPKGASDEQLSNLLKSLQDVTTGEVKTATQLMNLVFLQRGTRVATNLQSLGDIPEKLGISFEVTDLRGQQEPTLYTIWEPSNVKATSSSSPSGTHTIVSSLQSNAVPVASAPNFKRQQAQPYYNLGVLLNRLGLFEDAIKYFEVALMRDTSYDEATRAWAECKSHLQVQQSGASVYSVAKQFRDAGLPDLAIESYKKSLPIADQAVAEAAWKTIFKLTTGDEAAAYLKLARLYRKDTVYLFDQSIELYKAAVSLGSDDASDELETIQQTEVTILTQVGQILYELSQYKAAEKYLMIALTKIPNDPQAQAMLATVKRSKPPEEDKDALASYKLGTLYESLGLLDQARVQYEDALKKQPSYVEAKDALKNILKKKQTIEQRYIELLDPAVCWLAIELARRSMAAQERRIGYRSILFKRKRIHYRARLYNFIGNLHLTSGQKYQIFQIFYDLAVDDFKKAIDLDKNWYRPSENLANVYVEIGKKEKEQSSKESQRQALLDFGEAIKYYEEALDQLDNHIRGLSTETTLERQKNKHRIIVLKAIALLLTGDLVNVKEAKNAISDFEDKWDSSLEMDSHLLYNLACWNARLATIKNIDASDVTKAKNSARRYLAYSLARDNDLWDWAEQDACFEGIKEGVRDILFRLKQKLQDEKFSDLPKWTGDSFRDTFDDILK